MSELLEASDVATGQAQFTAAPSRLRLLCADPEEPSLVRLTLQLLGHGGAEPRFRWASTPTDALIALREQEFEALVVAGLADPLLLARAVRSSGHDVPLVVVAADGDERTWDDVLRLDGEFLASRLGWDSPALGSAIHRAVTRDVLRRENRRLAAEQYRRLVRERAEAETLLAQQRTLVAELEALTAPPAEPARPTAGGDVAPARESARHAAPLLPAEFDRHYGELLRAYIVMGSGSLAAEIERAAASLVAAGVAPREVLQRHLACVEALVRGLGSRSARHVMARADLLVLELMMNLGEIYRGRSRA